MRLRHHDVTNGVTAITITLTNVGFSIILGCCASEMSPKKFTLILCLGGRVSVL